MQFFRNVGRLLAWVPVIWRDREFDYAFLLRIMAFKLERMAASADKDWITDGAATAAAEMRDAAARLRRVADEDYPGMTEHGLDIAIEGDLKHACGTIALHAREWWD